MTPLPRAPMAQISRYATTFVEDTQTNRRRSRAPAARSVGMRESERARAHGILLRDGRADQAPMRPPIAEAIPRVDRVSRMPSCVEWHLKPTWSESTWSVSTGAVWCQ
jgi:hypothetical protein